MSTVTANPPQSAAAPGYISLRSDHDHRGNGNGAGGGVGGVAVLFVARDSIYKQIGCDCYDAKRDAMTYAGNAPVVAHPPCQLWGKMANVNYARWGGEHNRPGNDGGKFAFALATVNRCGGVLEHPADTYAWSAHGLVRPLMTPRWIRSGEGWVCEVWQSAYGHRARKRTWLYYRGDYPLEPRWSRPDGTHQVGFHDQRGKAANKPTLGRAEANATPLAFAVWLLFLAGRAAGAGVGRYAPTTEAKCNDQAHL